MDSFLQYGQSLLPVLPLICVAIFLVGVGKSPRKFPLGITLQIVAVLLAGLSGYLARGNHLSLPIAATWWVLGLTFFLGLASGGWASYSHLTRQTDWAILLSFVTIASFFSSGWVFSALI